VNFTTRLVAGTLFVLFFAVIIQVWTAEGSLRGSLEADVSRALEREAALVAEALPTDSTRWDATVGRLASSGSHGVEIVDRDGRVLAASGTGTQAGMSLGGRRDIVQALANLQPASSVDRTPPNPTLSVSVPAGPGVVRMSAPLDEIERTIDRSRTAALGAAFVALIAGSLLAWIAAQSVARPLTALAAAANAIAAGALPRFPRSGVSEIDGLVQALRQMHRQLQDRFDDLRREQGDAAALVESMVEGVIASDRRGATVTANAAARRLLGYDVHAPLPDLTQLFRAKAAREIVDLVLAGEAVANREVVLADATLLVNARPLAAGGAVLVIHDLTELRRLETVRRDFVANVSHELKTPLTSISGYAETLLGGPEDPATERRFIEIILNNARRMQRLVDDLLDLSRIESGRWHPDPMPTVVAEIATEVWDGLADRAAQRGIELILDIAADAAVVQCDPDALRQILTNLLDNAVRYSGTGGRVTCRTRQLAGEVEVAVIDTGAGIAGEHLERIFERFYRVDPSRARDEGGTGLGLSIVKHLVEAHEGRVVAESLLGYGTTIRTLFPG